MIEHSVLDLDLLRKKLTLSNFDQQELQILQPSSRQNIVPSTAKQLKLDASSVIAACSDNWQLYELDKLCYTAGDAFIYLYKNGPSDEYSSLIRKHQQFLIKLMLWKKLEFSVCQLSIIKKAITCQISRKFECGWEAEVSQVLRPVKFASADSMASNLVVAYHFLVFQCLLQLMSINGSKLLRNDDNFINVKLIDYMADMFLHKCDFIKWLGQAHSFNLVSQVKHTDNIIKLLQGYLKLSRKLDVKFPGLKITAAKISLKLLEFIYKRDQTYDNDILRNITFHNDLQEFINDLEEVTQQSCNIPTSLIMTEVPDNTDIFSLLSKINTKADVLRLDACLNSQNTSFHGDGAFILLCHTVGQSLREKEIVNELLLSILLYLESKSSKLELLSKQHISFLDFAVLHFKIITKNISTSDVPLVFRSLEAMKRILSPFKQFKRIRNLSNILFNLSCKTKNPQILESTVEYEFFILQRHVNSSEEDLKLLQTKLDKCANLLVSVGATKEAGRLLLLFISEVAVPLVKESSADTYYEVKTQFNYPSITRSIISCMLKEPSVVDSIMSLELPQLKAALFISITEQLDFFDQEEQVWTIELCKKSFCLEDPMLQLLCFYHYSLVSDLPSYDELQVDLNHMNDNFHELLMAGILLHRIINSSWNEEVLKRSIGYLELYLSKAKDTNPYEEDIVKTMVNFLLHSGLFGYVNYVVNIYRRHRNLSDHPVLILPVCMLLITQIESFLKFGFVENAYSKLEASSNLIRQLSKQLKPKDVIFWKLLQLEYYLSLGDVSTANDKFNSILKFLSLKPEFNLNSESSCDLETKLINLLVVARFHLVTCDFNKQVDNYIDAYRNCKMAIKILTSMFKKLKDAELTINDNILWEANRLIIRAHLQMVDILKHLGISRDMEYYLKELRRLTDATSVVPVECLNSLELFKYYRLLGMNEYARHQLQSAKEVSLSISIDENINFLTILAEFVHTAEWDERLLLVPMVSFDCCRTLEEIRIQSRLPYPHLVSEAIYISSCLNDVALLNINPPHDDLYGAAYSIKRNIQQAIRYTESFPLFSDIGNSVICSPCFVNSSCQPNTVKGLWTELNENILLLLRKETVMPITLRKDLVQMLALSECMLLIQATDAERIKDVFYMEEKVRSQPFTNELAIRYNTSEDLGILPVQICQFSESYVIEDFFEELETILPQDWAVLTVDLCSETGDLLLSRYACHKIQRIRLPLNRFSARDGAITLLSFEQAIQELNSIIELSNESIKPKVTSTIKDKEDRKKWWKLRFSLDLRLQTLLERIEDEWFGAFVGIFSANQNTEDFVNRLKNLMEIHLPSRRKTKPKLQFHDDVLSLFSALKLGSDKQKDHQKLRDMLYFLVDSLLYNGELNDYDEVDAESFFQDLESLIQSQTQKDESHVVLIPSSKCASLPWESLRCLSGKSISRMPSIQLLLDNLKQRNDLKASCKTAFYMVNPGGDLVRTETKFEPLFSSQKNWDGLVGRKPADHKQFLNDVMTSDLFIYLGHGGCEQYLRSSSLFKQSQSLPPSFLIGCSSGALQSYGVFGSSGNVYTWLACGSPMVLVNLWDVTDKDIDLFSLSVFETCGLLGGSGLSVSESVALSRQKCTLRYLNGCAPVVYGLPLHLKR